MKTNGQIRLKVVIDKNKKVHVLTEDNRWVRCVTDIQLHINVTGTICPVITMGLEKNQMVETEIIDDILEYSA